MPKKFIIQVRHEQNIIETITRIIRINDDNSLSCLYHKRDYPVMWNEQLKTWIIDTVSNKKES